MKKTNFAMGIIANILLIIFHISWMVGAIGAKEEDGQGITAVVFLIIAFVLLLLTYRAKTVQTKANGVWTIILGTLCGFYPLTLTILIAFFDYYVDPILITIIGSLSVFAIIARGIMTLCSRKNPYELDIFDNGAIVRKKNAGNITGALLALLGGLASALFGAVTLVQMFDLEMFHSYDPMLDISVVFYLIILIFSLVGAVVMLFNRYQGGLYILTCSILALFFGSVSLAYQDISAVLIILPPLALIASAVIGLVGYKNTKKNHDNEQNTIHDKEQETSKESKQSNKMKEQGTSKRKNKKKLLFIIGAGVLVTVVVAVALIVGGGGSKYKDDISGKWYERNGYARLEFSKDYCVVGIASFNNFDVYIFNYKVTNEYAYLINADGERVAKLELNASKENDLVILTFSPGYNSLLFYKTKGFDLKTLGEGYIEAEEDAQTITSQDRAKGVFNTFNKWLENMNNYNKIADKVNNFANSFADELPLPIEEAQKYVSKSERTEPDKETEPVTEEVAQESVEEETAQEAAQEPDLPLWSIKIGYSDAMNGDLAKELSTNSVEVAGATYTGYRIGDVLDFAGVKGSIQRVRVEFADSTIAEIDLTALFENDTLLIFKKGDEYLEQPILHFSGTLYDKTVLEIRIV